MDVFDLVDLSDVILKDLDEVPCKEQSNDRICYEESPILVLNRLKEKILSLFHFLSFQIILTLLLELHFLFKSGCLKFLFCYDLILIIF